MKKLLILATLCPVLAGANPYVEYQDHREKIEYSYTRGLCNFYDCYEGYTAVDITTHTYNTTRIGYEFEAGLYFEVGEGSRAVGFKKSFNNFDIELDHEQLDRAVDFVEYTDIRVRYTFGN